MFLVVQSCPDPAETMPGSHVPATYGQVTVSEAFLQWQQGLLCLLSAGLRTEKAPAPQGCVSTVPSL